MSISPKIYLILLLLTLISQNIAVASGGGGDLMTWLPPRSGCTLGECLHEEFQLESEISRRILATSKYISYGALQRNTVPCSKRGASYYNCRTGGQANPYSRGCSAITKCRS